MNNLIEEICNQNKVINTGKNSDVAFELPQGSFSYDGFINNNISFVEFNNLMNIKLWELLVNQFRQGNVDEANLGWRGEYWGKMMRGACFVYQYTNSERLYTLLENTVNDLWICQ